MRHPNGQRISVTCEYCGKSVEIHPYRAEGFHFCSMSCRAKAHPKERKGVYKNCECCGKSFYVVDCRKDAARFCSNECRTKTIMVKGENHISWKNGGGVSFSCIVCGKDVQHRKITSGSTYQFCSTQCHDIYRKKRVSGTCHRCGKPFERSKSRAHRGKNEYCSFLCFALYNVGNKSAQWRGGDKEYPTTFNKHFKEAIRERDNYTCAVCKKYGDNVHHIDYQKMNTVPENCVTLCRSCHCKTNSNREYWQEYFSILLVCCE